jgi:hypothetical protein
VLHLCGKEKEKNKNADSVNITGMERKGCCFVLCTTQWMQRHTTSDLENKNKRSFSVGVRQKPAHHQEYCSDIQYLRQAPP